MLRSSVIDWSAWQSIFGASSIKVAKSGQQLKISKTVSATDQCKYGVSTSSHDSLTQDNPSVIIVTGGKK